MILPANRLASAFARTEPAIREICRKATPGIPVPRPNRLESVGMTFINSVVHRWASRAGDRLRAGISVLRASDRPVLHCWPKTTNPAVIRTFCFAAVPHKDFWPVDLVGFPSVSCGFVLPARLHLTYPASDMSARRDPEVYGGYFYELFCQLPCFPVAFGRCALLHMLSWSARDAR